MRLPLADRIVLREMGMPLAAGLFAILQLLVVAQLLQLNEVVFSSAITLRDLGRVTAAFAPHFLVMAVPLAYMLGLQLGLGRLAADRELLALATAGQSPLRLYRVPCLVALALVHGRFWAVWLGAVAITLGLVVGLAIQYSPGARLDVNLLGAIPPVLFVAALGYAILGTLAALFARSRR